MPDPFSYHCLSIRPTQNNKALPEHAIQDVDHSVVIPSDKLAFHMICGKTLLQALDPSFRIALLYTFHERERFVKDIH